MPMPRSLIAGALETAVRDPQDLTARPDAARRRLCRHRDRQLLGRDGAQDLPCARGAWAGAHGLATALALEAILGWQVAADDGAFAAAAEAWAGARRDRSRRVVLGFSDALRGRAPAAAGLQGVPSADLAAEMRAPETQYMRRSTAREVTDADIDRFAAAVMALA